MNSICRFVSVQSSPDPVQTINFVYETKNLTKNGPVTEPLHKVCIVAEGEGALCHGTVKTKISTNDVFFIMPATPYTISATDDFAYMYISFMGIRANVIMERLGINRRNFVFKDHTELAEMWAKGLGYKSELTDLISEGLLLNTFAAIGNENLLADQNKTAPKGNIISAVKKYIDTNFSDSSLSLETISDEFSYNKNYISAAFKKTFGMGLREYLNIVRINNACVLMEQNYSSVEDIAYLCGYNDSLYFSKVFKKRMGISPKQHIKKRG